MPKNRSFTLTGFLCLCLVNLSCGRQANSPSVASAASGPAQVEVTKVVSQKLDTTTRLPGELIAYEAVDIFAKETGFVRSISVDRGTKVRQGDRIAQLDAPELVAQRAQAEAAYQSVQSQLAAAQAKLAADQATYQRLTAAAKAPGVVSANDLDIAQKTAQADAADVAALEKSVTAAQETLRAVTQLEAYLIITAPFDGVVTTRYVHPGTLVGPAGGTGTSTPLVRVETVYRHRLVVPVPENDVEGVALGTQVNFSVPSFPGRTFRAPIARMSHLVDLKTRTMPVELDVKDPRAELVPGSYCQVDWPVHRTYPTLFVLVSAVASDLQRSFVIRVRNAKAEWVDVKTGATAGKLIEVFGELAAGDDVAVSATDELRPGTPVSPRPARVGN